MSVHLSTRRLLLTIMRDLYSWWRSSVLILLLRTNTGVFAKSGLYFMWFHFVTLAKQEVHRSEPRTIELQIRDAFAAVSIDILSKGVSLCLTRLGISSWTLKPVRRRQHVPSKRREPRNLSTQHDIREDWDPLLHRCEDQKNWHM
jgi:hypothetical protein